jgi:hypothetical protein
MPTVIVSFAVAPRDVNVQPDVAAAQVRPIAHAGQRHRMHRVAGGAQRREHAAPDPGAAPGAMDEDDRGSRGGLGHAWLLACQPAAM